MTALPDPKFLRAHGALLADSHRRLVGRDIGVPPDALYGAPFALVSHGTQADPVFNYANRHAQQVFGYDWATFVTLPSRLSARAPERDERARLLEQVSRDGYIPDYSGVRVRADGRLFRIRRATVWNVIDEAGVLRGQVALFSDIEELS